jgi:hypothetical protein
MTLLPRCEAVETRLGVALTVTGVAQVMVMAADHLSETATTGDHKKRGLFLISYSSIQLMFA